MRVLLANATTFESVPWMEIKRLDGSHVARLELFPDDHGGAPTHWIVSTSGGRTQAFALRDLPTLRVSQRALYIQDRRVERLRAARCDSVVRADRNEPSAQTDCTLVRAVIMQVLEAAPLDADGAGGGPEVLSAPLPVAVTSDVGTVLLRYAVDQAQVEVSRDAEVTASWSNSRCKPETDLAC